jgi:1,4-alpha-glucan branching enzyme
MRKFICVIICGFIFFSEGLRAQLLTISPAFPKDTSSVSIIVDCTKGNQGLLNYANTSDVYVHVGVITNLSTSNSDWRYVPFTWGTTNAAANATSLGNNRYQYTINNIRNFFAVPSGEIILKVAILFRSGNGNIKQANTDGSDMYVNVYSGSLATQFIQPAFQPTFMPIPESITKVVGDSLSVNYITNKSAHLSLYFNGARIDSLDNTDSIKHTVHILTAGNQQIIGMANDDTTKKPDTLNFYVGGSTNFASLPSGAKEGINYLPGDTSVILVLFAPHKNKIVVVGDFNNWAQQTNFQMNETPDSNYFWIQINGLAAGTEYAYQYVIDDTLTLADYNTEKVLDKNVDPSISSTTYPNLKVFPSQASGTLAAIIRTAKPQYNWQVTNFQRPEKNNLRIYELLVRDFTAAGNWQTLMDTLSYLKTLGINAIEVMPFANFEGASSWGYNPNFYFAPDKVYGTETALKHFIDACHQKGMAVIMDMVLNHSFGSSPMVQMYWDGKDNIPAANNPWFNQYYTHPYDVGYQFNNSSAATMIFRQRVISYWLQNYHIDGYRFDLAKGFTKVVSCDPTGNSCTDNSAYDSTRINIWNTLYAATQSASPGSYCILEMFAVPAEEAVYANNGMMVWNNLSYNYEQSTMGYNSGWDLSPSIASYVGVAQQGLINYQESHDEERLQYKNEQYGNSSGSYTIKDTTTGLLRNEMAAAFWAMIPGPKMLWEFGELGYDYSINWCTNGTVDAGGSCRLVAKPARWDYMLDPRRKHLHDVYASLFKLSDSFPSLASSTDMSYSLSNAFRVLQVTGSGIGVTVIGNFDVVPATGNVTFPTAGIWYNYLGTDSVKATGASQSITLNPGDYKVYTSKNLNDTISHIVNPPPPDTSSVNGILISPNPVVNSSSVIKFTLSVSSNVNLSIYNLVGQKVGSFGLGTQAAGTHSLSFNDLPFNIYSLKNGIYILKLNSSQKAMHLAFSVLH